jgi:hypothetical protein
MEDPLMHTFALTRAACGSALLLLLAGACGDPAGVRILSDPVEPPGQPEASIGLSQATFGLWFNADTPDIVALQLSIHNFAGACYQSCADAYGQTATSPLRLLDINLSARPDVGAYPVAMAGPETAQLLVQLLQPRAPGCPADDSDEPWADRDVPEEGTLEIRRLERDETGVPQRIHGAVSLQFAGERIVGEFTAEHCPSLDSRLFAGP